MQIDMFCLSKTRKGYIGIYIISSFERSEKHIELRKQYIECKAHIDKECTKGMSLAYSFFSCSKCSFFHKNMENLYKLWYNSIKDYRKEKSL